MVALPSGGIILELGRMVREKLCRSAGSQSPVRRGALHSFCSAARGNAAIEFAIVGPLLIVFIFGIVCYGGYFWIAHNVQELANDSARAAVAGLTDAERQTLAQTNLTTEIANYAVLDPTLASVSYQGTQNFFTVSISYNASSTPFWIALPFLPMPSKTIVRSASVKLGGY
jgi:Flp pilus assembly protein TadG